MFYVYIIKSQKDDSLYKGKTDDLRERFHAHNSGKVKSTKSYRPWTLIYYEAFTNKLDAAREEAFLKSGKGRERLKFLLKETLKF